MSDVSAQVDGWSINVPSRKVAVREVIDAARAREGFTVVTLNLDHLVKLRKLPEFRRAYQSAKFVTADGFPVVGLARRQWPEVERTTGADLLVPLCQAASERGLSVFLFGSSNEVMGETARSLQSATNGHLSIVGYAAPPPDFDVYGVLADQFISIISQSECALCFLFLGAPKQEMFAARAVERGSKAGFICLGAAADFIAGAQVRAPQAVQNLGLEWFWRLLHNPRLASRYLQCALLLAKIQWSARVRQKT